MEMTVYESHMEAFKELVTEDPHEAYRRFGITLLHSLKAPEYFRERARFGWQPGTALEHYNLGVAESESGRHEEARALYEKALELDPELVPAWYNLAYTFGELGEKADQKKALTKFLDLVKKREELGEPLLAEPDEINEASEALEALS